MNFKIKSLKTEIRSSPIHGRGVFASRNIGAGEVVEVCPVIPIEDTESITAIEKTVLSDYVWQYGNGIAVVLGYGSLYNHSSEPNVDFGGGDNSIIYYATRDIEKGEELFVSYSEDPEKLREWGIEEKVAGGA